MTYKSFEMLDHLAYKNKTNPQVQYASPLFFQLKFTTNVHHNFRFTLKNYLFSLLTFDITPNLHWESLHNFQKQFSRVGFNSCKTHTLVAFYEDIETVDMLLAWEFIALGVL